ncbi:MAG: hypothetical protein AAGH82_03385 [Pseudomonadota bacterium]
MTNNVTQIATLGLPTLVVSDASAQLESALSSSETAFRVTALSSYAEANAQISASRFASVIVDLRGSKNEFALLLPRLGNLSPKPHVTVLASAQMADTVRAMPSVDQVLEGIFDTAALARAAVPATPLEELPEPETPGITGPQTPELENPDTSGPVQVLMFPRAFSSDFMPEDVSVVAMGTVRPEVIVLTEEGVARKLSMSLPKAVVKATPIIDLTGKNRDIADYTTTLKGAAGLEEAMHHIRPLVDRMRDLPDAIFMTEREEDILLARLVIRNSGIDPILRPDIQSTVFVRENLLFEDFEGVAKRLVDRKLLKAEVFMKTNCCPACDSARLLVREECRACRSTNINEVAIIHHFRCGTQAPETDFKADNGVLECPKCMNRLDAFSVDYDRPGSMMICGDCGNETGEAAIGMQCLDCGVHNDAAQMKPVTHYKYTLADTAMRTLTSAFVDSPTQARPQTDVGAVLRNFCREMDVARADFTVLLLKLDPNGDLRREHGERGVRGTTHLVERNLRETLMWDTKIVHWAGGLIALLPNAASSDVDAELPGIIAEARRNIALNFDPQISVLDGAKVRNMVRQNV